MTSRKGFSRKALQEQLKNDPEFAKHFKEAVGEGIGEALRDARKAADLSQKDVAERMGVTEARVTQLEKTTGNSITLRSLRRYATAVGCQLDIRMVNPSDSSVVSRLFVVDDFADEPIQIERSDEVVRLLASAKFERRQFPECGPLIPLPSFMAAYLLAKGVERGAQALRRFKKTDEAVDRVTSQVVTVKATTHQAWVPSFREINHVRAGV